MTNCSEIDIKNKVIILRGNVGSGKSTWCKENNIDNQFICSADKYFVQDGKYKFDKSKLNIAHGDCLRNFIFLNGVEYIDRELNKLESLNLPIAVVDNTNCFPLEMAPYIAIAQAYGHEVLILRFECSIKTSIERNIHNVPEETIVRMWQKLHRKEFPSWWPKEIIINTD